MTGPSGLGLLHVTCWLTKMIHYFSCRNRKVGLLLSSPVVVQKTLLQCSFCRPKRLERGSSVGPRLHCVQSADRRVNSDRLSRRSKSVRWSVASLRVRKRPMQPLAFYPTRLSYRSQCSSNIQDTPGCPTERRLSVLRAFQVSTFSLTVCVLHRPEGEETNRVWKFPFLL